MRFLKFRRIKKENEMENWPTWKDASWCLLQFEEQLLKHRYAKQMRWMSHDTQSLFMHFNRDERIARALYFFSSKHIKQTHHENRNRINITRKT